MPLPYSERFVGTVGTGRSVVTYQVPAGKRAVVRSIDIVNVSGVTSSAYVRIVGTNVVYLGSMADGAHYTWDGRQVAYAGEAITVAAGVNVHVIVSGYLLS